jgi:soluble lytic murein transglycosylase
MPARLDPAPARPRRFLPALLAASGSLGLLFLGALALPAAATPAVPWIEARSDTEAERALQRAVQDGAFAGPQAFASLVAVSEKYPGTSASGLGRLGAGLLLLEGGRHADAIVQLRHADVARTRVADHAALALGRARALTGDLSGAASDLLRLAAVPGTTLACPALLEAADAQAASRALRDAASTFERAAGLCPEAAPRAVRRMAECLEDAGDRRGAAIAFDRLDREWPTSPEARESGVKLRAMASLLPPVATLERAKRNLAKGLALFADKRFAEAAAALRQADARVLPAADADLRNVRLGRSLLAMWRTAEGLALLRSVPPGSAAAAEAAFALAQSAVRRGSPVGELEGVASAHAGTPWAEEALLSLANHFQKDALDQAALPYYQRLLSEYPEGRYTERAAWRVGWSEIRAARYEEAAQVLERGARASAVNSSPAGFLYWAGRARLALGQTDRARQRFQEAVLRFKHTYHGLRATEALSSLPPVGQGPPPGLAAPPPDPALPAGDPKLGRVQDLLLIDRREEALAELGTFPSSTLVHATIAWLEWRRGRLRPAIMAMKRAFPEHASAAGDRLSPEALGILYPLEYREPLLAACERERLPPALVAALILQESTFNPGAISRAGARGLMQILPGTGRTLARTLGLRYRSQSLYDADVSLRMGTRYLRDLLDRFGGHVERALAAYNAGPHRVDAWTAGRTDVPAEEFIESIPFTETRHYVMTLIATQERYRTVHGLAAAGPPPSSGRP